MALSPVLDALRAYPFVRLEQARDAVAARGVEMIDFGIGEPREDTPAFIREALIAALEPQSRYPLAVGLPDLRQAIARWAQRRTGAALDPDSQVIPTLGSKEVIFHLPQIIGPGTVAVTTPGYPVAERGALFAGRTVVSLELNADNGFVCDLAGVDLNGLALLWVNHPNNPTGSVATRHHYEHWAALARAHDFVLASDEAYSEIWFHEPPASALEVSDLRNVLVVNTLSKRSSMPGYRSGFAAGDPALIAAMRRYRPNVGVAPQEFVQRAAIAAWNDEDHVDEVRKVYAAKREVMKPALEALGLRDAGGAATFFLWMAIPPRWSSSEAFAGALLQDGVVVTPGSFLGDAGEGYVRVALVPTLAQCEEAAERLSRWRAEPR